MSLPLKPIGVIRTPFNEKAGTPVQSSRSDIEGSLEVYPQYGQGLEGIEDFSHIYLLYYFDRAADQPAMKVIPLLDDTERGLFTTRFPCRPNQIGLSIVRVLAHEGNLVRFKGADMLDGTPLLDIKPYIQEFDVFAVEKSGWYQHRSKP